MKYLTLVECDQITFFRIKKKAKSLVTVKSRLYPLFDDLYIKEHDGRDAYRINRIDSTQPVHVKPTYVDPDYVRVLIKSMKIAGQKKKMWLNMDASQLWKYLTGVIIIGALIYGFLVGGGL